MEFLYTRQQMEGFKGYNHRVKIGNWSEDMELDAVIYAFFISFFIMICAAVSITWFPDCACSSMIDFI